MRVSSGGSRSIVMRWARPLSRWWCCAMPIDANIRPIPYKARGLTAFSNRERVGCEATAFPLTGSRPTASLCRGSSISRTSSLPSSSPPQAEDALTQQAVDRVPNFVGISAIG